MNEENSNMPEAPNPSEDASGGSHEPPSETLRQLKSTQTLVTVAAVSGPVSLLIGGVLLAGIAVIAGILALVKVGKLSKDSSSEYADLVQKVKRSALVALAISVAALVLNAYALATIMPIILDSLQSGDTGSLLQDLYGGSSTGSSAGSGSGSSVGGSQGSSVWG